MNYVLGSHDASGAISEKIILVAMTYYIETVGHSIHYREETITRIARTKERDAMVRLLDTNSNQFSFTSAEPDYSPTTQRGSKIMTHDTDLKTIMSFASSTSELDTLKELLLDLLNAIAKREQGDMSCIDETIESWADTIEIESDPKTLARVGRGLEQAKNRTGRTWKPSTRSY